MQMAKLHIVNGVGTGAFTIIYYKLDADVCPIECFSDMKLNVLDVLLCVPKLGPRDTNVEHSITVSPNFCPEPAENTSYNFT